jgi:hypothetical protein
MKQMLVTLFPPLIPLLIPDTKLSRVVPTDSQTSKPPESEIEQERKLALTSKSAEFCMLLKNCQYIPLSNHG